MFIENVLGVGCRGKYSTDVYRNTHFYGEVKRGNGKNCWRNSFLFLDFGSFGSLVLILS